MTKTKELLDGLAEITKKPNRFQVPISIPDTNRYSPDIPHSIHKLPKIYDKAKRYKDADGDPFIYIDRVYGGLYGQQLTQKDGTTYKGKLYKKRRLLTSTSMIGEKTNYYSSCTVTADGRWFDNGGLPIEAPTKLEPEKVKTKEELEEELQDKIEKEKAMLQNLQ